MTENEFTLEDRLTKIKSVIEQYGEDNFYISFSGGKDSTVLSVLVDMAVPENKIPRVFADTGIELNMIRKFVLGLSEHDDRFVILKPSKPIKQMLEEVGYPFKSKKHSRLVDRYQRMGFTKSVENYVFDRIEGQHDYCPDILKYQFSPPYTLKTSSKCCDELKKKPLKKYQKDHNKNCVMLGIRKAEAGAREFSRCISMHNGTVFFQPLSVISDEWENWFVNEYKVDLCILYSAPYDFKRTGCKGCPYNIHLQKELDILECFFPSEKKQCEIIWKPVYDEYRRLGYRLKKIDESDPPIEGQISFDDLIQPAKED